MPFVQSTMTTASGSPWCLQAVQTNISRHALTTDGSAQGTMDNGTENGISTERCAAVLLRGIDRNQALVTPGKRNAGVLVVPVCPGHPAPRLPPRPGHLTQTYSRPATSSTLVVFFKVRRIRNTAKAKPNSSIQKGWMRASAILTSRTP